MNTAVATIVDVMVDNSTRSPNFRQGNRRFQIWKHTYNHSASSEVERSVLLIVWTCRVQRFVFPYVKFVESGLIGPEKLCKPSSVIWRTSLLRKVVPVERCIECEAMVNTTRRCSHYFAISFNPCFRRNEEIAKCNKVLFLSIFLKAPNFRHQRLNHGFEKEGKYRCCLWCIRALKILVYPEIAHNCTQSDSLMIGIVVQITDDHLKTACGEETNSYLQWNTQWY